MRGRTTALARRRRALVLGVAGLVALVLCGCGVSMPESGPVRGTTTSSTSGDEEPASIDPPRPKKGDTREEIVRGFLYAMTATPAVRTSIAREFLTREASADWNPSGIVVYDKATPRSNNADNAVDVDLENADLTDARGAWLGPLSTQDSTVQLTMASEDLEWRISQPPPYLLVPRPWFEERFGQVSLYFFDPSGSVLIPEPVFVPRGRQFASSLVNGLLQNPSSELSAEQDFLPGGLRSVVSVPVSAAGVAQVDLTSDTGDVALPSPDQADLLVSQLAWTLGQDPTISRFQVSIDGRQVQLPGESSAFSVDHGHEYAPYVAGSSTLLYGLRDGVMVGGSPQNLATVTGPFGSGGYALRSVSPDLRADRAAGVSQTGTTLWEAPVKDNGSPAKLLTTSGEDLLRPAWDFSGRLWEVDRRASGAVVSYVRDGTLRTLDVPGISGQPVKSFLVSRDGSRLVAVIRGSNGNDRVVVSRIVTVGDSQVVSALAADDITPEQPGGRIRDIAWRSPTSVVVLHPVTRTLVQVHSVSVDGATAGDTLSVPIDENVLALAGTPVPDEALYAFAREERGGQAINALIDVADPRGGRIEIGSDVSSLSYVG